MGEIKSTLELVLERTRHLSLSDEEKARQKNADFDKRLQGLLQRYADGALSIDTVQQRMADLQAELSVEAPRGMAESIVGRIDPDQDNQCWLDLIGATAPALHHPLEAILAEYSQRVQERRQQGAGRLGKHLAAQHGISGPAVVPNPLKDSACREDLATLRQRTLDRLAATVNPDLTPDQT